MPTIAHLAVGLAAGRYMARNDQEAPRAMAFGAVLATLPDWDLISHAVAGVQDTMAGHRGASHSLIAAAAVGALIGVAFGSRWWGRWQTSLWAIPHHCQPRHSGPFQRGWEGGTLLALDRPVLHSSFSVSVHSRCPQHWGSPDPQGHPGLDMGDGDFLPVFRLCLLAPGAEPGGDSKTGKFRGVQRVGSGNIHIGCIFFTLIATLSPVGFSTLDVPLYSLWNIGLAHSLQVDN